MSKATPLINSFSAGELSPKVDARVDVEKYYSGCRTLENMVPLVEGGAMRMPGTYYVTSTKSNGIARLIPFQFSTIQTYVLEFGDQYIRFYKDKGQILSGPNPYEITTPYLEADLFELKFFQSADVMWITHPSYPVKQLSRTGDTAWTLTNFVSKIGSEMTITAITNANPAVVSASDMPTTLIADDIVYISGIVGMVELNDRFFTVGTVTSNELMIIKNINSAASAVVTCVNVPVSVIDGDSVYISGVRCQHSGFSLILDSGRYFTISGVVTGADGHFAITLDTSVSFVYFNGGTAIKYGSATFQLLGEDSSLYAAYVSDGEAQKSLYGTDDNNPACGAFFEQRLGLGGSNNNPQRFDLSVSGDYDKFTLGDAIQFTIVSAKVDRILWMLGQDYLILGTTGGIWKTGATTSVDPITQTNIDTKKIINIGTKNIDPETITESLLWISRGGTTVRKLRYSLEEDRIIAVDMTRIAKHIAMGPTAALSGIKQMAFQKESLPINWAIRKDGQLLGLTYETQENVFAWFRVITDGNFESVAVIGDEDEEEQIWVVVNRTIGGSTKRYVEYFKPVEFFSQIKDCFFVHSGLTWDGGASAVVSTISQASPCVVVLAAGHVVTTGDQLKFSGTGTWLDTHIVIAHTVITNTVTIWDETDTIPIDSSGFDVYVSGGTVEVVMGAFTTGLDHLEGKTLDALIDGAVQAPQVVVTGGSITLSKFGNKIHIGLPCTAIIEPMKLHAGAQLGTARGKLQKVTKLIVAFHETIGCKAGPDQDTLYNIPFGTGRHPTLFTGDKEFEFPGNWEKEATISIVQEQPLPMMIMAIVPEVIVSER